MHHGSCLCGKITYLYEGEITEISMCHCSQCRKAQGSAFAAVCPIDHTKLQINGKEHIKEYASSIGKIRAFCGECGSPLYSQKSDLPDVVRLRIGTLDTLVETNNCYHKFIDSKAEWYKIADGFPQHRTNN